MTVGSLCTGGGGLDLAVHALFPTARAAWVSETDKHASRLLEQHMPGVPNIGDCNLESFAHLPPVDIVCGGVPCQPYSTAGKRKGGSDERDLLPIIPRIARDLAPSLILLENVAALVRAPEFAALLGELAEVGYDARWTTLRASDVGACHRRERLFVVAHPHGNCGGGRPGPRDVVGAASGSRSEMGVRASAGLDAGAEASANPERRGWRRREIARTGQHQPDRHEGRRNEGSGLTAGCPDDAERLAPLLPTPTAADGERSSRSMPRGNPTLRGALLPTPTAADGRGRDMRRHGAPSLRELDRLLPTPNASIGRNATARKPGDTFAPGWTLHDVAHANRWGDYAPAIARHAATIGGGPPPEPLDDKGRLNAVFVEWMMAWPSGHVTGRGLARSAELRILGNGVVPPQAFAAYDYLLNLDVPA